jgi:metal-dependent amidase/aminoacylase/carboxypeptidase family protein
MADELADRLRGAYRDLRTHPELSFQEHRTAGMVAGWLKDLGFEVSESIATTGAAGVRCGQEAAHRGGYGDGVKEMRAVGGAVGGGVQVRAFGF